MLLLKFNSPNWLIWIVYKRLFCNSWTKTIDAFIKGVKDDRNNEYNA